MITKKRAIVYLSVIGTGTAVAGTFTVITWSMLPIATWSLAMAIMGNQAYKILQARYGMDYSNAQKEANAKFATRLLSKKKAG